MKIQIAILISLAIVALSPLATADMGETDSHIGATVPAFGASNNIPSEAAIRHVFGSIVVAGTSLQAGIIVIDNCAGSVTYIRGVAGAGSTQSHEYPYSFSLTGGSCYRFLNSQNPGGVNAINSYHYIDVWDEEFEGRNHANVTRVEMNATRTAQNDIQNETRTAQNDIQNATRTAQNDIQNETRTAQNDIQNETRTAQNDIQNETNAATYESQVHANATWCPLPCDGGSTPSGGYVGNEWFNGTFIWNPQFGNVSALSLNVGWMNTTELDVLGNVTLLTAADPFFETWLPVLIWGGLFVFMLYMVAWLPAIAALTNLASVLPNPDVYGIPASVMLFTVSLGIYVMAVRGLIPAFWGKAERKTT